MYTHIFGTMFRLKFRTIGNSSDVVFFYSSFIAVPFYGLLSVGVSFMIAKIPGPISQVTRICTQLVNTFLIK